MLRRVIRSFGTDSSGAIAPMYAIALFALVGIAGIGFDYGRLMAMDSELQNAADQAALAAATQLDGRSGAITRAQAAANTYFATAASAYVNETRFSTIAEGGATNPRPITSLSFTFYDGYNNATDTPGAVVTTVDADAKVVKVTVNGRRLVYALTPVVAAASTPTITANAMATIQGATCNVPPLMVCIPTGSPNFPTAADVGKGLLLHVKANAADPWAPGNFGFLDIPYDTKGNPNRRLGLNTSTIGCTNAVINSDPGERNPEVNALNTRFDIYSSTSSCNGTGDYCPAKNVTKNWVRAEGFKNKAAADLPGLTCDPSAAGSWMEVDSIAAADRPPAQGFNNDTCFAAATCPNSSPVFGDGIWDGAAYMTAHHPGTSLATAAPNGTRYEVYNWELADPATRMQGERVGIRSTLKSGKYDGDLFCAYPQPMNAPPGIAASNVQKDRRVLTVAAVDCTGLTGSGAVKILRWVDLFLVTPANSTGSQKEFTTEVVGLATRPGGGTGFQYYGRGKAVLIQ